MGLMVGVLPSATELNISVFVAKIVAYQLC